jgi:hypothetical protein
MAWPTTLLKASWSSMGRANKPSNPEIALNRRSAKRNRRDSTACVCTGRGKGVQGYRWGYEERVKCRSEPSKQHCLCAQKLCEVADNEERV